jgi:hypothetical protein
LGHKLVVVCYTEMSGILSRVGVRVSNKGSLPVIMDEGVGNGDIVSSVSELFLSVVNLYLGKGAYINKTIIVVLVMGHVRRQITVVDPHVSRKF